MNDFAKGQHYNHSCLSWLTWSLIGKGEGSMIRCFLLHFWKWFSEERTTKTASKGTVYPTCHVKSSYSISFIRLAAKGIKDNWLLNNIDSPSFLSITSILLDANATAKIKVKCFTYQYHRFAMICKKSHVVTTISSLKRLRHEDCCCTRRVALCPSHMASLHLK